MPDDLFAGPSRDLFFFLQIAQVLIQLLVHLLTCMNRTMKD